jgi:hypothetical protein
MMLSISGLSPSAGLICELAMVVRGGDTVLLSMAAVLVPERCFGLRLPAEAAMHETCGASAQPPLPQEEKEKETPPKNSKD